MCKALYMKKQTTVIEEVDAFLATMQQLEEWVKLKQSSVTPNRLPVFQKAIASLFGQLNFLITISELELRNDS